ncbi:N-acetylmuramyl-L-alanine amidase, negative regulator of AmpC, AmpD [Opitutus terrae PB90-1]|uniref:N-acetylmuramoyl-L-alanine amidase n=1 Tax=Opitutus terrae (strain DSM 11246 / JCM 15787 / PB90-1) TaxID=452637 RepID=B1ZXM8_OPITP|nr:N-acetylmuramyl-L-alanine amidase, negative regulator of AmpC, AmpD [Opitutus terrae PB90-1]
MRDRTAAVADDAMVIAGQRVHTGTRVVTWLEPSGYNAYSNRGASGRRDASRLAATMQKRIARRGWDRRALREAVDQLVVHYDACGLSSVCFDVLQQRGLSVHFLIDIDGTVYQTMDLREKAGHATVANDRSIGIELANIGAYPPREAGPLAEWYRVASGGGAQIVVPARTKEPRVRTPGFIGRPARSEPIRGVIQGRELVQYDFTPQQYAALIRLTAALCREFPRLRCEVPRRADGAVLAEKLPDAELARYRGILGHWHVQENKVDPGPAFEWARFLADVRQARR